jgi:hypothetical protein
MLIKIVSGDVFILFKEKKMCVDALMDPLHQKKI